jgi:predicted HD superfamily hydrolase involved in NAD metabolism
VVSLAETIAAVRAEMETRPPRLLAHVERTLATALPLARRWQVDETRVELAVWGHDLHRHRRNDELLALAWELGEKPDPIEISQPVMIHGRLAAATLARQFAVGDAEVLEAVRRHTTARPGMSLLEQVVFVADKVEPRKLKRPHAHEIAALAQVDLRAAVLCYLDTMLEAAARGGWPVHDMCHAARNELLLGR